VPTLYRGWLKLEGNSSDTFLDMSSWTKGIVIVNGFNLGRYWNVGPQQTLYVPAPVLKAGKNEIIVFELEQPSLQLKFVDKPNLGKG
jgi:beta-galactosidase